MTLMMQKFSLHPKFKYCGGIFSSSAFIERRIYHRTRSMWIYNFKRKRMLLYQFIKKTFEIHKLKRNTKPIAPDKTLALKQKKAKIKNGDIIHSLRLIIRQVASKHRERFSENRTQKTLSDEQGLNNIIEDLFPHNQAIRCKPMAVLNKFLLRSFIQSCKSCIQKENLIRCRHKFESLIEESSVLKDLRPYANNSLELNILIKDYLRAELHEILKEIWQLYLDMRSYSQLSSQFRQFQQFYLAVSQLAEAEKKIAEVIDFIKQSWLNEFMQLLRFFISSTLEQNERIEQTDTDILYISGQNLPKYLEKIRYLFFLINIIRHDKAYSQKDIEQYYNKQIFLIEKEVSDLCMTPAKFNLSMGRNVLLLAMLYTQLKIMAKNNEADWTKFKSVKQETLKQLLIFKKSFLQNYQHLKRYKHVLEYTTLEVFLKIIKEKFESLSREEELLQIINAIFCIQNKDNNQQKLGCVTK